MAADAASTSKHEYQQHCYDFVATIRWVQSSGCQIFSGWRITEIRSWNPPRLDDTPSVPPLSGHRTLNGLLPCHMSETLSDLRKSEKLLHLGAWLAVTVDDFGAFDSLADGFWRSGPGFPCCCRLSCDSGTKWFNCCNQCRVMIDM